MSKLKPVIAKQPLATKPQPTPLGQPSQPIDDERYPGSFFRVPGVPMPGKTTWSLNQ